MSDSLQTFRHQLDDIDKALVDALGRRLSLCREIAAYKRSNEIPMMQPHRVEHIKRRCTELGREYGLDANFVSMLYGRIIAEACRIEDDIIAAKSSQERVGESELQFLTLGPTGTCHELAAQRYLEFHNLNSARIEFISNFMDAVTAVRAGEADFIIQNSAHPDVYKVTEAYPRELFVVDTFLCPTKPFGVLTRRDIEHPRTIGMMPATRGYIDTTQWEDVIYETANPIVGQKLLAGEYDSGFTFLHYATDNPTVLRVDLEIGAVDTAWLVYGRNQRCHGQVVGLRDPNLFEVTPSSR